MSFLFESFAGDDPLPTQSRLDKAFSWLVKNPGKALGAFFALVSGLPFLIGVTIGFTLGVLVP